MWIESGSRRLHAAAGPPMKPAASWRSRRAAWSARTAVPSLVGLLLLSACSWWPLQEEPAADQDIISSLFLDSPNNSAGQRRNGLATISHGIEKQASTTSATIRRQAADRFDQEAIEQCLSAQGLPAESQQPAHPSNYDLRLSHDATGQPVLNSPLIIVLHETVASEADTLNLFRTPHNNDDAQSSYHMLIPEDGRRVRIVADAKRAFGAGNSAFQNYTIQLKPGVAGSINNIALHLSLVSPGDGRGDGPSHSGYSARQYHSAAGQVLLWQAHYGIPMDRLTTHRAVDQSNSRTDPRSFAWNQFLALHRQLARLCGLQALTKPN